MHQVRTKKPTTLTGSDILTLCLVATVDLNAVDLA